MGLRTIVLVAGLALLAWQGEAAAQLGFGENFESGRGQGVGKTRAEAEKHALQNAIADKVAEKISKGDLKDHEGYEDALKTIVKSYKKYVYRYEVVSAKGKKMQGRDEKGQPKVIDGAEVTVQAVINAKRMVRDIKRALRMAELAKYGNRVAVLLTEWKGPAEDNVLSPDRYATRTVERIFMTYEFKRVPSQSLKRTFEASLLAGKRLKDDVFQQDMAAQLRGLGGHIVLLGSVETVFKKKAPIKDKPGKKGNLFEVSAWIASFERKDLTIQGRYEFKKKEFFSTLEDQEEARIEVLGRAGERLAESIIDVLVAEKPEEEEVETRSVLVIFENVSTTERAGILSKLEGLKSVKEARSLRYGRRALVMRATALADPDSFLRALRKAFEPQGFKLRAASDAKVIFKR